MADNRTVIEKELDRWRLDRRARFFTQEENDIKQIIATLMTMPPAEAVRFLESKGLYVWPKDGSKPEIDHETTFAVAGITRLEILQDVYDYVRTLLREGQTIETFRESLGEHMEQRGWTRLRPWHANLIARQNLQSAYQHGRYERAAEVADRRPYWQYVAITDSVTTSLCRHLDGAVRRHDDPLWERYYPPNHFNCRSTVLNMSEREVKRRNIRVPEHGAMPREKPGKGFGKRPGKARVTPEPARYASPLRNILKAVFLRNL